MDHETGYLLCLLEVGGPRRPLTKNDINEPTSTVGYLNQCQNWYFKRMPAGSYNNFAFWWLEYKRWIMRHNHG